MLNASKKRLTMSANSKLRENESTTKRRMNSSKREKVTRLNKIASKMSGEINLSLQMKTQESSASLLGQIYTTRRKL